MSSSGSCCGSLSAVSGSIGSMISDPSARTPADSSAGSTTTHTRRALKRSATAAATPTTSCPCPDCTPTTTTPAVFDSTMTSPYLRRTEAQPAEIGTVVDECRGWVRQAPLPGPKTPPVCTHHPMPAPTIFRTSRTGPLRDAGRQGEKLEGRHRAKLFTTAGGVWEPRHKRPNLPPSSHTRRGGDNHARSSADAGAIAPAVLTGRVGGGQMEAGPVLFSARDSWAPLTPRHRAGSGVREPCLSGPRRGGRTSERASPGWPR